MTSYQEPQASRGDIFVLVIALALLAALGIGLI